MLSHLNVKPIRTKLKTHRRKTKREKRKIVVLNVLAGEG